MAKQVILNSRICFIPKRELLALLRTIRGMGYKVKRKNTDLSYAAYDNDTLIFKARSESGAYIVRLSTDYFGA